MRSRRLVVLWGANDFTWNLFGDDWTAAGHLPYEVWKWINQYSVDRFNLYSASSCSGRYTSRRLYTYSKRGGEKRRTLTKSVMTLITFISNPNHHLLISEAPLESQEKDTSLLASTAKANWPAVTFCAKPFSLTSLLFRTVYLSLLFLPLFLLLCCLHYESSAA